jgi:DNA polymerase-3 subunit epsilon
MQYAIVDIETTGGTPQDSRITEICVVVTDGYAVLNRFETLLNPGVSIPIGITQLTGIDNSMVADAPVFADIAGSLHHLLHDKVFVAHNVNFDFSFIQSALKQCGLQLQVPRMCTARAARKVYPGRSSYSLGTLCNSLGIHINNRHRAGGDADGTVILFHNMFAEVGADMLMQYAGTRVRQHQLPLHIDHATVESLPASPGVYHFLSASGKPLYTGKAINIKKRVLQHFDTKRGKSALQLEQIHQVSFEESGSEFMALLIEAEAIERNWPEWNKAGKTPHLKFAIVSYPTANGEFRLQAAKRSRGSSMGIAYSRLTDARSTLSTMIREFGICPSRAYSNKGCEQTSCYCSFSEEERRSIHNERIEEAMEKTRESDDSYLILCKGRKREEKGVIWIQNGSVMGRGFCEMIPENPDPEYLVTRTKDIAESRIIAGAFLRRIMNGMLPEYQLVAIHSRPMDEMHVEGEAANALNAFQNNPRTSRKTQAIQAI